MEEQQTGMATPSNEPSTEGGAIGNVPSARIPAKPNRRQRRFDQVVTRRQKSKSESATRQRLANFRVLQAWKDRAKGLTPDQVDSVFRVTLAALFKKEFSAQEFEAKLNAVVRNVKNGFKYPADVKHEQQSATVDGAAAATQDPEQAT